ncbi:hypothetical protein BJX68DRAFT_235703 [Aspergillus pseudodeflectus]|uniref:Uncharacterized protein n=1 Tax=Aspergillus pseudodeflectus TaxID=176178 RepID=A0ABR4KHM4_9EURO
MSDFFLLTCPAEDPLVNQLTNRQPLMTRMKAQNLPANRQGYLIQMRKTKVLRRLLGTMETWTTTMSGVDSAVFAHFMPRLFLLILIFSLLSLFLGIFFQRFGVVLIGLDSFINITRPGPLFSSTFISVLTSSLLQPSINSAQRQRLVFFLHIRLVFCRVQLLVWSTISSPNGSFPNLARPKQ